MPDILKVNHLTKKFGQLRAVDGLSFEVREGEILGMMGPNGAGKTTVFNLLTGVFKPDEGTILFKARDITRDSPARRCHQGIGRTYQIPRPLPPSVVRRSSSATGFLSKDFRPASITRSWLWKPNISDCPVTMAVQ